MIVTMADNIVIDMSTHKPIFVDCFICSFQKAITGTTASTISVNVVYAHSQYEKSFRIAGSQHFPGIVLYHSFCVGVHCAKTNVTVTTAKMIWRMVMA